MAYKSLDGEKTWRTHVTDRRFRHLTRRVVSIRHATCRHQDSHVRCALRCLTHPHNNTPHRAKKDVLVIDRRHPYSGSTTRPSGGQLGSVTSKRWPMYMDGIRTNEPCRWFRTWTRKLWMLHRSCPTGSSTITTCSSNFWAPGSIRRLEFRRQGRDSMAGRDAIKRMQILTLIPSQSCVDWATRRAHRNFVKNS